MIISSHARHRRAALAGIVALIALVVATGLGATAAARRASSSLERALDQAGAADISVDVANDRHLDDVASLTEVTAAAQFAYVAVRPAGTDLVGGIDLVGVVPLDDDAFQTMDRPRISEGRLPRPDRPDEVIVNPGFARAQGIRVGDDLPIEAYSQDQVEAIFSGDDPVAPSGATIDATVVGIGQSLDELTSSDESGFGVITFSAATWREHGPPSLDFAREVRSDVAVFRLVLRAQLRNGDVDADRFLTDLGPIYGDGANTTFSEARPDVFRAAHDSVKVIGVALALFAITASIAGLVIALQAISREVAVNLTVDEVQLRALGVSRRTLAVTAAVPTVLAVTVGVLLGEVGAVAASSWVPSGLIRMLEPDLGRRIDRDVLALGGLAAVTMLLAAAGVMAWRATHRRRRPSTGAEASITVGTPAAALGVRMALSRARGSGMQARSALVAAIVATTGVVAASVFGASLDRGVSEPRIWGDNWHTEVVLQVEGAAIADRQAPSLIDDGEVAGLTRYSVYEASFGGPDATITGVALRLLKGSVAPGLLRGRLPKGADEVALDVGALPGRQHRVGDWITMSTGDRRSRVRVVGVITGTGPAAFVTSDALADTLQAERSDEGFLIRWTDGTDRRAAEERLASRFAEVEHPGRQGQVGNLEQVRGYPTALGVFFALLGIGSLAHLCATAVRRRRRDLAIVKALGFTRSQVRAVLTWQATTVTSVGLLVGVPAGLFVGRLSWASVTQAVRIINEPVVAAPVLLGIAAGALLTVNALALAPGWIAARRPPAHELHTE